MYTTLCSNAESGFLSGSGRLLEDVPVDGFGEEDVVLLPEVRPPALKPPEDLPPPLNPPEERLFPKPPLLCDPLLLR